MRTRRRVSTARSARPPTAAPRAVWRAKKRSLGQPVAWLRPRVQAPRELMAAEPPPPPHTHTRATPSRLRPRGPTLPLTREARDVTKASSQLWRCGAACCAPQHPARALADRTGRTRRHPRSATRAASPPPRPRSAPQAGSRRPARRASLPPHAHCCSAARSPACRPSRRPPATPHPPHRTIQHPHLPLPRRAAAAAPLRRAEQRGAHRWRNAGCLPRAAAAHCVPHARFNADECSVVET